MTYSTFRPYSSRNMNMMKVFWATEKCIIIQYLNRIVNVSSRYIIADLYVKVLGHYAFFLCFR